MALEPTTPHRLLHLGDENGTLAQLIGDDNQGTQQNRELGPRGMASRASTRRDGLGDIDIPEPMYEE